MGYTIQISGSSCSINFSTRSPPRRNYSARAGGECRRDVVFVLGMHRNGPHLCLPVLCGQPSKVVIHEVLVLQESATLRAEAISVLREMAQHTALYIIAQVKIFEANS